jgi:hypothetical protein
MELTLTEILPFIANLGGVGLLIWYLNGDRNRERVRNETREAKFQANIEELQKTILALQETRIAQMRDLSTLVANSNTIIAAQGVAFQKLMDFVEGIEDERRKGSRP